MFKELVFSKELCKDSSKKSEELTRKFVENFNKCSKGEFEFILPQKYIDAKTKISIKHTCGEIISMEPRNLFDVKNGSIKTGCKKCRMEKVHNDQRYTKEIFIEKLKEVRADFNEYEILSEYKNTNEKIKVKHTCGNEYFIRPRELIQGNCCIKCNTTISKGEKELVNFIKEILQPYNLTIIENAKGIVDDKNKKLELDVYIPDLNIAFEYNGEFWHSEKMKGMQDYDKFLKACNKDIRIISIFESEWQNKKELVKTKIKHILGINDLSKVYARKCIVKEIDSSTKNLFLDENHIQGKDTSYFNYGMFYNDELVAVMTFSKPRKSLNTNSNSIELSRFASNNKYIVIGAFSKIFKVAKNDYRMKDFSNIITFANLRYSIGEVYETNGFKFSHTSKPSYWYFKNNDKMYKLYHRYNFIKKNIEKLYNEGKLKYFNSEETEYENMIKNNFNRIFDYGNLVYYMDL